MAAATLLDPTPLRNADAYYVANMNLAHTPSGLRLVQVDPEVIRRILAHLELPLDFPTVAPSRAPPESAIPF